MTTLSSKIAQEHLSQIRKYGMDEGAILKSFKTDHNTGVEHLVSIYAKLSKAEGFSVDHKSIIDEAKQWGYNHDDIAIIKSLIDMDESASRMHIKKCVMRSYLSI